MKWYATTVMVDCIPRSKTVKERLRFHLFATRCARLEKEMKVSKKRVSILIDRLIAIVLVGALCGTAPGFGQQSGAEAQPRPASARLPDAPEPMASPRPADGTGRESSEIALAPGEQQPVPAAASPAADSGQQQTPQKPVGTAAAPPESAAGITASKPAGAVIAPAKQRRARAIFIRVGLLVGAGVALGTVLALTHATPAQPPR